jgi:hypothetical protein
MANSKDHHGKLRRRFSIRQSLPECRALAHSWDRSRGKSPRVGHSPRLQQAEAGTGTPAAPGAHAGALGGPTWGIRPPITAARLDKAWFFCAYLQNPGARPCSPLDRGFGQLNEACWPSR